MEVETEDRVKIGVEVDVDMRVPVELKRFGRRTVLGKRDGMTKGIFVRVQQNSRGVVVPSTPIRVQSQDIGSNHSFDVKVCW
jgi:hypothetical protein